MSLDMAEKEELRTEGSMRPCKAESVAVGSLRAWREGGSAMRSGRDGAIESLVNPGGRSCSGGDAAKQSDVVILAMLSEGLGGARGPEHQYDTK